jgi:hypothetical protein
MWIHFQYRVVIPHYHANPTSSFLWLFLKQHNLLMQVCVVVKLCMVNLWQLSHSNQNTQASIIIMGIVKVVVLPWDKRTRRQWVDQLVWRLITTITQHYMHVVKMKKQGFIKSKVMEHIINTSIEKVVLFFHTYSFPLTFKSGENDGA